MGRCTGFYYTNYAKVFPQNQLNKITISISKADWDSIKIDMKEKFNTEFGKSSFPRMDHPMVNVQISRTFHRCHKMANDPKVSTTARRRWRNDASSNGDKR
jgi:hypothetical protein